ncbi:ibr domain containing protein [Grosmannia clavigera kw1407]|uniref:RBR-type E3 ubiquitin transferase n=1 Tax=Grosmannia clavigera (strain kw1407 / UAMH 11150) TaxID=655863 RepID=F0XRH7_GROCL|nr:ibr domain containing protein [Grosmannia clavigera kw1407]EFW99942.1 ibr domain containing protein [Grosmannia clavigera kw1407]
MAFSLEEMYQQEVVSLAIPYHGDDDGTADFDKQAKGKERADEKDEAMRPIIEAEEQDTETDTDTDEEKDKRRLPRPGSGSGDDTDADYDDLSWMSVPPPAALTEGLTSDLAEVLVEIARSSIEGVQARAAQKMAERAARAEQAQIDKAKAGVVTAEEVAERAAQTLVEERGWPLANRSLELDMLKGKGKESAEPETAVSSSVEAWPQTQTKMQTQKQTQPLPSSVSERRSRSRMFAARLLRHVHVHSRSQNSAESSAAGAAAGATAAAERDLQWLQQNRWLLTAESGMTVTAPLRAAMLPGQATTAMPEPIECISCFDETPAREAVRRVCHSYCLGCFRQLVATAVSNEAQFPAKCCLNEVPSRTIRRHVTREVWQRYAAKAAELAVPVSERLYCAAVNCGMYVPASQQSRAARIGRCSGGHETCTMCRQIAHGTGSKRGPCAEDRDGQLADELAADAGWRRCQQCSVLIEHADACQHMTCRCGGQFCYVCGAVWRTCECTMEDLQELKARAAERQAARAERERAAEAATAVADQELQELREALRAVEELEREETQRQERQQAERTGRLERLRDRREAVLRREAPRQHVQLAADLQRLTGRQEETARKRRRQQRADHQQAQDEARAAQQADQASEQTAAAAEAEQLVRTAEQAWAADYSARVRLEQRVEAGYRADLLADVTLWADRPDRLSRIDAAVRVLMRRNDGRLDAYLRWRDGQLAAVRCRADENRAMGDELRTRARRLAAETQLAHRTALCRVHDAERTWVRVVAAERCRQLEAMLAVKRRLGLAGSAVPADAELLLLIEFDGAGTLDGVDIEDCLRLQETEQDARERVQDSSA